MASDISSPISPPRQLTPAQLARALDRIVAEETTCLTTWAQHPEPVTPGELRRIALKICALLWNVRGRE